MVKAEDAPGGRGADGVTAGLVVIGDEVLSGRTQDANTAYLGHGLNAIGIELREVRVVPDLQQEIVRAVNELRARFDYVFTTGGIGPTHDDITAESIARAFNLPLTPHPEALARLERRYGPGEFNESRRRMAYTPEGATLIDNPVSGGPGFQIDNVFVMAGIPRIMQAMFDGLCHRLVGGAPLVSRTLHTNLSEGALAGPLADLQKQCPDVRIGSYPATGGARRGVRLVLRAIDTEVLDKAFENLTRMVTGLGGEGEELGLTS